MSDASTSPPFIPPPLPGIHGNSTYMNFEFSFLTLPALLLFVPIIYMPVTIIIILRIFVKLLYAVKDKNVNVPLFSAICIAQFMCLLFFVCDYVYLRMMTAGVFTKWCANVNPNGYLIILYVMTYYVNYATMLFPFLVSSMRIVLFVFPQRHSKINAMILRTALPIIFIYPWFSLFFMVTATGYCTQAKGPYPFGSVILGFQGSLFGLRNGMFLLGNNLFWMSATVINNLILLVKLIHLKTSLSIHARSQKSHKAEVSLTFTTFSMIFSYLSNSMVVITNQLGGDLTWYAIMLRPFGNDLETCVVPWVFYLTHPVFRRKSVGVIPVLQRDKINFTPP
uniref:Serpentine receptor class gamma n=2 Tax=Caenorhabditis tropicalis TaxID=1561998 RepID=A0A1I7TX44_9PELO